MRRSAKGIGRGDQLRALGGSAGSLGTLAASIMAVGWLRGGLAGAGGSDRDGAGRALVRDTQRQDRREGEQEPVRAG